MNVRKNYIPWMISAQLKHRHGLKDRPETLYLTRNNNDQGCPFWCEDPSAMAVFHGTQEDMEQRIRMLNEFPLIKESLNHPLAQREAWHSYAAVSLMRENQEVLSIQLEKVILVPVKKWAFEGGRTTISAIIPSLHSLWMDAYSCFKAVLDTPIGRRKNKCEHSEEARKLFREIDESIKPTILN